MDAENTQLKCSYAQGLGSAPFILLDSHKSGEARLYRNPLKIITAFTLDDILPALSQLRCAEAQGYYAAGFLAYEAGYALEAKLRTLPIAPHTPLLWFGIFAQEERVDSAALLPHPDSAWLGTPEPLLQKADYCAAVDTLLEKIAAGDIYEANFTFQARVPCVGEPLALFASIRARAGAAHGALVFTGDAYYLSASPELFFTLKHGQITARPMKGTLPRGGGNAPQDLQNDPKQRAENLMIVDLLRNDLSRVAKAGSVQVPQLFTIEAYPHLWQMTSTVTAALRERLDAVDVLTAIFPCGSITGAPKIRAMELIAEQEANPRGLYTGSIGVLTPQGDADFNVAIRTLCWRDGVAHMGLGSAIVADSQAEAEWQECCDKGTFIASPHNFELLETMRVENGTIALLDLHLARLARSAAILRFSYTREKIIERVISALKPRSSVNEPTRLRLRLSRDGCCTISIDALPATPPLMRVKLVPHTSPRHDFRLHHKTSDRALYDNPRRTSGVDEVVFYDAQSRLTEGSFTNIFVERDGMFLTPDVGLGLLGGVLRQSLLHAGRAKLAELREEDLHNGFYVGNALRGLIPALLVQE
jgi:para-aminobenzoate synthetase / 4-amino-4-deoxychorismate lyase